MSSLYLLLKVLMPLTPLSRILNRSVPFFRSSNSWLMEVDRARTSVTDCKVKLET